MIKVNRITGVCERVGLPPELYGLYGHALEDLSWTQDPRFVDYGWWQERVLPYTQPQYTNISGEILTINRDDTVVDITYIFTPWTQEEIDAEIARQIEALEATIVSQVTDSLNAFAATRKYDSITSLCTYANSTDAQFKAEGLRGVLLRDQCYRALWDLVVAVKAGAPMPTSIADIDLPELTWEEPDNDN